MLRVLRNRTRLARDSRHRNDELRRAERTHGGSEDVAEGFYGFGGATGRDGGCPRSGSGLRNEAKASVANGCYGAKRTHFAGTMGDCGTKQPVSCAMQVREGARVAGRGGGGVAVASVCNR